MQRPGEKRYLLFMQTCMSVMSTACPWSEGRDTRFICNIHTYIIHLLVVKVALAAGLLLGPLNSTCPARINLFIN